jgi:hypothetical protein
MKRLSCAVFALTFVLIVIGIQPLFAQVQGQWASTGTMQSARELNAQALLSNGKDLSIGPPEKFLEDRFFLLRRNGRSGRILFGIYRTLHAGR